MNPKVAKAARRPAVPQIVKGNAKGMDWMAQIPPRLIPDTEKRDVYGFTWESMETLVRNRIIIEKINFKLYGTIIVIVQEKLEFLEIFQND